MCCRSKHRNTQEEYTGIHRKNTEGSGLLDYVDDDLYLVDEDVERENDNENGEVEAENEETQTIIGN